MIGEDNAVELLKKGATDYVSKSRLARLAPVLERALRETGERRVRTRVERQLRQADRTFADAATVLALCLEEYGYVVEQVGTCADALRAARRGVALSGSGRDQDRQRSSQAGFAAHLVKPADPAQVHACLSRLLSGSRASGA